ncbi:prolyl oligopeptidase family serine peptidase [candidate division KSB1 bacterium]|nr:prolyl oligopeptidase family serine peptidase [candidate division KSB1 bacterium]
MMQEYLVRQIRLVEQRGIQKRSNLATSQDVELYVREVREKIKQSFGTWPEKTPLHPQITAVYDRGTYRIENLIFESRPDFLVTANVYIPQDRTFPLPGVVGTCGHSNNGKAAEAYQSFAQGLVRQGYVVLIYDPISQGERLQYTDDKLESTIGVGVREHLYAGNQQFLVGEFIGSWRAWDGIRALDYLQSRPEVNPDKIGVTGNSGGGTMTTWLCGVEDRWSMAAPSCFVTTFRRNAENELSADTEQCPPKALALGLDHADFLAAMLPKPVIILAKEKDFFDVRGSIEAYQRLSRLYSLAGYQKNVEIFIGPTAHGYTRENREAMYRWFNGITGISNSESEPELVLEDEKKLWSTPHGQVVELYSRPIYDYTRELSQKLAKKRSGLTSKADLIRTVANTLKLDSHILESGPPEFRILRDLQPRDYPLPHFSAFAVETEPDIFAVVYRLNEERMLSRPQITNKRAILYISHLSADDELRNEPLIRELIAGEPESIVYTCDVRGIGESKPVTGQPDSFFDPYGNDYFYAIHGIMLDKPYVGQRTLDVLRVLQWLRSHGHENVHLVGKGWGALPATFAALMNDQVVQVTLKYALTSYTDIAESKHYAWPLSCLLPDVLKYFDLPDCYKALEAKGLKQIDMLGAEKQPEMESDF